MKKRILPLLLTLVMLVTLIPAMPAQADIPTGVSTPEMSDPGNSLGITYSSSDKAFTWQTKENATYEVYFYADDQNGEYFKTDSKPSEPSFAGKDYGNTYEGKLYPIDYLLNPTYYDKNDNRNVGIDMNRLMHIGHIFGNATVDYDISEHEREYGFFLNEGKGTLTIRGWFNLLVKESVISSSSWGGEPTVTYSSKTVWLDYTTPFPGVVCNATIQKSGGTDYLVWDPAKNAEKYMLSFKVSYRGSQEFHTAFTTDTRYSLTEVEAKLKEYDHYDDIYDFTVRITACRDSSAYFQQQYSRYFRFKCHPVQPTAMRWDDADKGFVFRWSQFDFNAIGYGIADSNKSSVELKLSKEDFDTGESRIVYSTTVPLNNGVLSAGSFNFNEYVVENGDGLYTASFYYTDKRGNLGKTGTNPRSYYVRDYLYYTSQTPDPGKCPKVLRTDSLNVEYRVAELPQWMKTAGYVTTSPYVRVYDNDNKLIKSFNYGSWATSSWDEELDGVCTSTPGQYHVLYTVYLKKGNNNPVSAASLGGAFFYDVLEETPPNATAYKFLQSPKDMLLENDEPISVTWKTNLSAQLVRIELYDFDTNTWQSGGKILGRDTAGGTVSYTPSGSIKQNHTRQLFRISLQIDAGDHREYAYSDPFYVTWTNDGKEPTKVSLPSRVLSNGYYNSYGTYKETLYYVEMPFNYGYIGKTGYGENNFETTYKLYLTDENGLVQRTLSDPGEGTVRFNRVYEEDGSVNYTMEVIVSGKEAWDDTTQHFMLAIYNSSSSSSTNRKGIPAQNVYFDVTWQSSCSHKNTKTFNAQAATCLSDGYSGDICCADCGKLIKEGETLAALGHDYKNGVCTRCGAKDPDYKPPVVKENPFVDVSESSVYYDAILWAYYHEPQQITGGFDATHFVPGNPCTRAQVVTFLWRAKGCPEPTTTNNPFSDVSAKQANGKDNPYYKAILWAAEEGITTGYAGGLFKPNDTVTRGQFVTFLWRYEGKPATSGSIDVFPDASSIAAPYQQAVAWAVEKGITTRYNDGTFRPNATCTRWAVVLFMYRDMA